MTETVIAPYDQPFEIPRSQERKVVIATSVATAFEWYDFYLFTVLAPVFAKLFFPSINETAALLGALTTYVAGFVVRPFGGILFGRLGDRYGRKFIFLITLIFMGFATFTMGLIPTFAQVGWLAPVIFVFLRIVQGLAVGGEYGGAAVYVAEFCNAKRRGFVTSWIQITPIIGFFLALAVVGICRSQLTPENFESWGWRIPFLLSIPLLMISIYIRLTVPETPVFAALKMQNRVSRAPVLESFFTSSNSKLIWLALLGATAGQGVIGYTTQFYTLFFLTDKLQLDYKIAYIMFAINCFACMVMIVFFGWLSDRIGRLRLILLASFLAAMTYFPIFYGLSHAINPSLTKFQEENIVIIRTDKQNCNRHVLVGPWSDFSVCDQVRDQISKFGLSFRREHAAGQNDVVVSIGNQTTVIQAADKNDIDARLKRLLFSASYPGLILKSADGSGQTTGAERQNFERQKADLGQINYFQAGLFQFILALYIAMIYGPMAAFLSELFPARIRYTSLSFAYHAGNGWFGGVLPLVTAALVISSGNIYGGIWYPVAIAGMTFVFGALFLSDRRHASIYH